MFANSGDRKIVETAANVVSRAIPENMFKQMIFIQLFLSRLQWKQAILGVIITFLRLFL